ncbi:hypothetical protein [Pseudescherichia sp.]|uniref:hypothetical protein n=1 Tax=Pseudescherichia sp. TaxID=2055881 RepID=UPI0028B01CFF|nr:hypothetical protein [Pseudescherichia sp.]
MKKINITAWRINLVGIIKIIAILIIYGVMIWGGLNLTSRFTETGNADTVLVIGVCSLALSFISSTYFTQKYLPEIRFAKSSVNIIGILSLATAVTACLASYFAGEEKITMRNVTYIVLTIVFFVLMFLDTKRHNKNNKPTSEDA